MGQFGGQPYFEGPIETKSRILMPEYGDKELMLEMIRNKFNEEESKRRIAAAKVKEDKKTEPKMIPSEYIQHKNEEISLQTKEVALANEMRTELAENNNQLSDERLKYYEKAQSDLAKENTEHQALQAMREAKLSRYTTFMNQISDNGQMKNYIADNDGRLMTLGDLGFVKEGDEGFDSPVTYEMANRFYTNEGIGYAGNVPEEFFTGAIDPKVYTQQRDAFLPQIEQAVKIFSSDKKADIEQMVKEGRYDTEIIEELSDMFESQDSGGLATVSASFKQALDSNENPVLKRAITYSLESQKADLKYAIQNESSSDKMAEYEQKLHLLNSYTPSQYVQHELMVKSGGGTKLNSAIAGEIAAYKQSTDFKKHDYTTSYLKAEDQMYAPVEADIENYGSVELDQNEVSALSSFLDNPEMLNEINFDNPGIIDRIEEIRKDYQSLSTESQKLVKAQYLTKISNIIMLEKADSELKEAIAKRSHYFGDPIDPATGIHFLVNQQNTYRKAPLADEQLAEFWPQLKVGTSLNKGDEVYMFGQKMKLPFDGAVVKKAESYVVGATDKEGDIESIIQMEVIVPISMFAPWAQSADDIMSVPDEDALSEGRIKNESMDLENFADKVEKGNGDPAEVLGVYGYDFDSDGNIYNNTPDGSYTDKGYTTKDGVKYVRVKIGIPVTEGLNQHSKKLYSNPTSERSTSTAIYNTLTN